MEDAWQYSSSNVLPIFLRQFLISGWEFTNLELLKKSNFVFMYLEFFKRFNLVLKTQLENENKRIKNCIIEEVTCIGFFFRSKCWPAQNQQAIRPWASLRWFSQEVLWQPHNPAHEPAAVPTASPQMKERGGRKREPVCSEDSYGQHYMFQQVQRVQLRTDFINSQLAYSSGASSSIALSET